MRNTKPLRRLFALSALSLLVTAASAEVTENYREVLVRLGQGVDPVAAHALLDSEAVQVQELLVPSLNLYLVRVKNSPADDVVALDSLRSIRAVSYVQEDHAVSLRAKPNDTDFAMQWGLDNPEKGADVRAQKAWQIGTGGKDHQGNDVVIAIVDDGMDIEHPDLAPNVWTNEKEIPDNGIDDDENGYIDDVHGWNAFENNGSIPKGRHGTHVAGIAGARGNNGNFGAGVNWDVKLMAVPGTSNKTSVIAKAYGYIISQKQLWLDSKGAKGANIVATNSSFGVDYADCESNDFLVWNDLYNEMGKVGILSAAATANIGIDIDKRGDVPTGCSSEFLITVTNTTIEDEKYASAGYGKMSVDLGAPGTRIYSTLPGGRAGNLTGTSMATPHVAGSIALLHAVGSKHLNQLYLSDPARGALEMKKILLDTVDVIESLKDVTLSGGRLNLFKAADAANHF